MRKVKVKVFRFKFRFAHWIGRSPKRWPAESVSWATLMHWEWNLVCRPERKHRLPSTRWDDNLTFSYICSTVTQWEMVACCQGSFLVVRLSADLPNPLWFVQFWPPVSSTKHRNFESDGRKWKKLPIPGVQSSDRHGYIEARPISWNLHANHVVARNDLIEKNWLAFTRIARWTNASIGHFFQRTLTGTCQTRRLYGTDAWAKGLEDSKWVGHNGQSNRRNWFDWGNVKNICRMTFAMICYNCSTPCCSQVRCPQWYLRFRPSEGLKNLKTQKRETKDSGDAQLNKS